MKPQSFLVKVLPAPLAEYPSDVPGNQMKYLVKDDKGRCQLSKEFYNLGWI